MGFDSAVPQHRQPWRCIQPVEPCIVGDGNYSMTSDSGHGEATAALAVQCWRHGVGFCLRLAWEVVGAPAGVGVDVDGGKLGQESLGVGIVADLDGFGQVDLGAFGAVGILLYTLNG